VAARSGESRGTIAPPPPATAKSPAQPGFVTRTIAWVKRQVVHVAPAFIFFFVAFNFVNQTTRLMVGVEHMPTFSLVFFAVAAGVLAKVLLVVDHAPFVDLFRGRPLIYNIVWKSLLYSAGVFTVRFLEHLIEFAKDEGSLPSGFRRMQAEFPWNVFFAGQAWYAALFVIFVTVRELARALGSDRVRKLVFGW